MLGWHIFPEVAATGVAGPSVRVRSVCVGEGFEELKNGFGYPDVYRTNAADWATWLQNSSVGVFRRIAAPSSDGYGLADEATSQQRAIAWAQALEPDTVIELEMWDES